MIPVAFGTAHDCLFEFGGLKAGQTVLVQAGASGVGPWRAARYCRMAIDSVITVNPGGHAVTVVLGLL